jgi:UDP-glucose 4-epimerase
MVDRSAGNHAKLLSMDHMISDKPSCVVLGGGGFIGTALCRRLVVSGFRVRAFGRRCLYPEEIQGAEWYQGDFADAGALAGAIANFDVVFHLVHATTPQSANLDMGSDLQKNVVSSLALLDICRELGVKRVVYVSSGGTIYGCPQEIPTPETAPTEPITAYGIGKLATEKYLGLYRHLYGLDYRVLRVANPFGPLQTTQKNQGVIAAFVSRMVSGESMEIWGDGSVVRDFIYVDDVVDALEAVIGDDGSERVFNIGSGQGKSLREIAEAIERLSGRKLEINWKPKRSFDVPVSVLAIDRAREVLKLVPKTPFESALKSTIAWWHSRSPR